MSHKQAICKGNNPILRGLTIIMVINYTYKSWDDPPSTPHPGCQWPPGFVYIFRLGNPNLNLHLPLESWVGGRSNECPTIFLGFAGLMIGKNNNTGFTHMMFCFYSWWFSVHFFVLRACSDLGSPRFWRRHAPMTPPGKMKFELCDFLGSKSSFPHEPRKKKPYFPLYWLFSMILTLVYYNPHITGQYTPYIT